MSSIFTLLLVAFLVLPYLGNAKRKAAAAAGQPRPNNVGVDEYADSDEEQPFQPQPQPGGMPDVMNNEVLDAPVVEAVCEAPTSDKFDLRQAVIAQTVLNNDYINELK